MKMREPAIAAGFTLLCSIALGHQSSNSNQLPVVDLGYELHQAAFYNVSQTSGFARTFTANTYGIVGNWQLLQFQ